MEFIENVWLIVSKVFPEDTGLLLSLESMDPVVGQLLAFMRCHNKLDEGDHSCFYQFSPYK